MTTRVAIVMGSQSDWETMKHAQETLEALNVESDARIVSAHRTPDRLAAFAKGARDKGFQVIIAGAGGAAHLPGMVAAMTPLPVFGVPVRSKALWGQDSLLSIVQMPAGIPVGTLAIRKRGNRGFAGPVQRRQERPFRRQPLAGLPVMYGGQHFAHAGIRGTSFDPDRPLRHGGQHIVGRDRRAGHLVHAQPVQSRPWRGRSPPPRHPPASSVRVCTLPRNSTTFRSGRRAIQLRPPPQRRGAHHGPLGQLGQPSCGQDTKASRTSSRGR